MKQSFIPNFGKLVGVGVLCIENVDRQITQPYPEIFTKK